MPDFSSIQSSTKLVGSEVSKPEKNDSALSLIGEAAHSALYSGIQNPVSGVAQIIDKTTGTNLMPNLQFIDAPSAEEFGSARWHAQQVGGAAGMIAPFLLARSGSKAVLGRAGLAYEASSLVAPTAKMVSTARQFAVLESATAGFVFDSVMRPVTPDEGNFWAARMKHGAVGALTFGGMTASSIGFKSAASSLLKEGAVKQVISSNFSTAVASGVPAGLINAEASSLLFKGKLATGRELGESVYTMSFAGGALSALHAIPGHEKSTVQRATERLAAPTMTANQFLGINLKVASKSEAPSYRPSSIASKMSELIGSGQTGRGSLSTRISNGFRSALESADNFIASINPLMQMQPEFAMASAYGRPVRTQARSDFGGSVLMSSMLEGGRNNPDAIVRPSPDSLTPPPKWQVDLAAVEGRTGKREVKERGRERENLQETEPVETVLASKAAENTSYPEVAEYIANHPKLRNLRVLEEPLGFGNDSPIVLEVPPGKEFPDGAVLKVTIPEGGWVKSWGKRSFDAEINGKVHEIDMGNGGTAYLYLQEVLDLSSRIEPEKLNEFFAKIKREGLEFEDPGSDPHKQVGTSRKTGELRLLDYPTVDKKGSRRTQQEITYGQEMIEEEYDAENVARREGREEVEPLRDDVREVSRGAGELSPERLTTFQREVLEQLTAGITQKEVLEYTKLLAEAKAPGFPDVSKVTAEVKRIHQLAKKQGLLP